MVPKEPATAAELNTPCVYLRKSPRPEEKDDFARWKNDPYEVIAAGCLKLFAATANDIDAADTIENITTYKAVDRWKPGILTTDMIKLSDGRMLHIRKVTNWMERNKWVELTLVYREVAIAHG
jgi:hypothetical protein